MSGLTIYMSNRTEVLAEWLAAIVAEPRQPVLEPEIIVVQSRGMQRWLSLELARHNGICANADFPFPKAFLAEMVARLVPGLRQPVEDDLETMTCRLMRILPECLDRSDFAKLRNYLADDRSGLKLLQLCRRIASLFDQYVVYRHDMLLRWGRGEGDDDPDSRWQALLWRRLLDEARPGDRLLWPVALPAAVAENPRASELLPARAAVFGISYLPPLYLQLLTELGRVMQLNLFWMNPSREYWGDIVSESQANRLSRRDDRPADDLHLESGNRLLAASGIPGRCFMRMLVDSDSRIHEHYEEPSGDTLLCRLQTGILDLCEVDVHDRLEHREDAARGRACPDDGGQDRSIQVHSCHSPLREMEVLHDNLLALFEADPGLKPGDIVVMAPDIEAYAPFVHAVFGTQTDPEETIPYGIADRSPLINSGLIDGFMELLELHDSRYEAPRVLRLLQFPGIKERFELDQADLAGIEHWVRESQIRWGIDTRSRTRAGLPAFKENTWTEGFRRLLLGYAMPTGGQALFDGILPYDHIEGNDTLALGNFIQFVTGLFEMDKLLADPKPVTVWRAVLSELLQRFFAPAADQQRDIQLLRQTITGLAESAAEANFEEAVDLALMRHWLKQLLRPPGGTSGFLGQGVTFCAMLPMRSIPFKVVCLVGMDNAAFPRDAQPMDFDLMARRPRPGDRSRRDDDRYLFLEALLSARSTFYISYVGQHIQDNSPIPPSVLVRELLNALEPGGKPDKSPATVHHRLQPFSSAYFRGDAHLFSYSRVNTAVCARAVKTRENTAFFHEPLPLSDSEAAGWQQLDPQQLALFWRHPCRFLLRRRLGVYPEVRGGAFPDCERFKLEGLERYQLGEDLLQQRLDQTAPRDQRRLLAASGQLPPANAGRLSCSQLILEIDTVVDRLTAGSIDLESIRLDIDFRADGLRLNGTVPQARPGGCVTARFARSKARDLLQIWIYHLAHGIAAGRAEHTSYLFCTDRQWKFDPVADGGPVVEELLALFREGLTRPLAFIPESSFAYADARIRRGQPDAAALRAASRTLVGSEYAAGEADDPYVDLCFRHRQVLTDEFKQLAMRVYGPLLHHLGPVVAETAASPGRHPSREPRRT